MQFGSFFDNGLRRELLVSLKGKGPAAKLDEFLQKFQRGEGGGGIFNPKIYVTDFRNFKQGFLSMKLIQRE